MTLIDQYVTLTLSLPDDLLLPNDGEGETYISVQTANSSNPVQVAHYKEPILRSGRWNFYFSHNYTGVSVKYRVNVSMSHKGVPLLIDLDHFVIVHRMPHRQTLNLSPVGRLYIQAQGPQVVKPEEAVTIAAHEHDNAGMQLTKVHISEQLAEAFYLEYDPDAVVPGKRYTLTATENEYRNSIEIYPESVVLKPLG
ncbi:MULTISPECIES: hypothetical protein [unclassified Pseudomonas]|uniref:Uncharacterized protein n=1 Tax=Pseudomonas sp. MYb327 TaxID=2745230 RepID=A0AAU8E024_9PSED